MKKYRAKLAQILLGVSLGFAVFSATAQDLPPDAYTVSGVVVDITATNAATARDQAFSQAQSKAWVELQKRISATGQTLPERSGAALARSVGSVELESEKASAVRYIGTFTVRFKPQAVAEALGGSAEDVAQALKPYVVLPITIENNRPVLWEDRTAFRTAWEEAALTSPSPAMIVPPGNAEDLALVSATEAAELDEVAMAKVIAHYNATGVVVPVLEQKTIRTRVFDTLDGRRELSTTSGEDLAAATQAVWRQIKSAQTLPPVNAPAVTNFMTVVATFGTLSEWPVIRNRLQRVRAIEETDVQRFNRTQAEVALRFKGDTTTLGQAMAREGLRLVPPGAGGNVWYIVRSEG